MSEPNCEICFQPMELEKSFGKKPRGINKKRYRIRRFTCDICNVSKTVFADGSRDDYHATKKVDETELPTTVIN